MGMEWMRMVWDKWSTWWFRCHVGIHPHVGEEMFALGTFFFGKQVGNESLWELMSGVKGDKNWFG